MERPALLAERSMNEAWQNRTIGNDGRRRRVGIFIIAAFSCLVAAGVLYRLMPVEAHGSMVVYLGSLFSCLLFATLEQLCVGRRVRCVLVWLAVISLALPMALRAQTGTDDLTYKMMFLRAQNIDFVDYISTGGKGVVGESVEWGYLALNYVLYRVTDGNYDIAQMAIVFLTFAFFAKAMSRSGGDVCLPLQLLLLWSNYYFTIMDAGLVRIFLAAAIVFLALSHLFDGDVIHYIVLLLLASTFHMSALFMLVVLPLGWMERLEERWGMLVAKLMVAVPLAFLVIARFLVPLLGSRYSGYGTSSGFTFSLNRFDMLPLLVLCAVRIRRGEGVAPRSYYSCLVLIALSVIISVCSSVFPLGRLVYFSNLSIVYLCPRLCTRNDGTVVDYAIPVLFVAYAFFYVGFTRFLGAPIPGTLFPYRTFL